MIDEPTVTSEWTRAPADWAERRGLDVRALLAEAGIDGETLHEVGARIPYRRHVALWKAVARRVDDPSFGLDVVDDLVDAGTMGILGLLAESCRDLAGAFRAVAEANELTNQASLMKTWAEGDRAYVLDAHERDGTPYFAPLAEAVLTFYCRMILRICPGPSLVEVRFAHRAPRDTSRYANKLGAPVRFGQPQNLLVLHRDALHRPITSARATLHAHLRRQADAELEALARKPDLVEQVLAIVRLTPPGQPPPAAADVARRLGMSARSLQRRLADRDESLRSLVDDARRSRAWDLVTATEADLAEISWQLGFSDPRGFRRAFNRWFGQSPLAARDAATAS